MNIKEQLLIEHSKSNAQLIANYIGNNSNRVEELISCFISKDFRLSQRSAMVVSSVGDQNPQLLIPHIDQLVERFLDKKEKDSVIRVLVRFFQFYDLPEKYQGIVLERSYELLKDNEQAIAIRAFSGSHLIL